MSGHRPAPGRSRTRPQPCPHPRFLPTGSRVRQLGSIILGLSLLGRIAARFGMSPIPLYLLGGLAFGHGGVLALSASDGFIEVGAEIGVIQLLLLLGLEYNAGELVSNLRAGAPADLVDLVLNALPGLAAGFLLGFSPVGCLAPAGVTWISSSGVIAKVLGDLGQLGNHETPAVLSVLVLEDLAMALYLPILTALLAGVGLVGGTVTVLVALGAIAVVLVIALRHGPLVSKSLASDEPDFLLPGVLGVTILVAGVADQLKVSAAVDAFLVGIAISDEVAEHAQTLLAPLRDLFAAVFFVFFGLPTDPVDLPPVLLPAEDRHRLLGRAARRHREAGSVPGRGSAGGAGRILHPHRGLGGRGGDGGEAGAAGQAYVLILVVAGPLTARYAEPALRKLFGPPVVRRPAPVPDEADLLP